MDYRYPRAAVDCYMSMSVIFTE